MTADDGIVLKHYTHKELAVLYNVARCTLRRWLKPHLDAIGKREGHYYSRRQVEIIFALIGWPPGGERLLSRAAA